MVDVHGFRLVPELLVQHVERTVQQFLGAGPVAIASDVSRAGGSPNFRDGVFVNLEPASNISLTREQQFALARGIVAGGGEQRPAAPIPLVRPDAAVPLLRP